MILRERLGQIWEMVLEDIIQWIAWFLQPVATKFGFGSPIRTVTHKAIDSIKQLSDGAQGLRKLALHYNPPANSPNLAPTSTSGAKGQRYDPTPALYIPGSSSPGC